MYSTAMFLPKQKNVLLLALTRLPKGFVPGRLFSSALNRYAWLVLLDY